MRKNAKPANNDPLSRHIFEIFSLLPLVRNIIFYKSACSEHHCFSGQKENLPFQHSNLVTKPGYSKTSLHSIILIPWIPYHESGLKLLGKGFSVKAFPIVIAIVPYFVYLHFFEFITYTPFIYEYL